MSKWQDGTIEALRKSVSDLTIDNLILNDTLERRQASLDELRELNNALNDTIDSSLLDALNARDAAWLAEAKLKLYLDAQALPAYYTAPTACCKCGSQNLVGRYGGRQEPNVTDKWEGRPERIGHHCNDCGASLGYTRTLEDSK